MLLAIGVSLLIIIPIVIYKSTKTADNKNPISDKVANKDYWDYLTKD